MADRPTTPRVPPLPPAERSPSQKDLLDSVFVAGAEANVFTTLARAEGLFRRWLPFGGKLLRGKLPARHRELAILRTAWNCRAEYEWAQHVVIGQDAGLSHEEIDRVPDGPDAPGWAPVEAAVLRATDELHAERCITDRTWITLTEHYDTAQLVELPMLVGHYEMLAMTLNTLGVPLDDGLSGFPR